MDDEYLGSGGGVSSPSFGNISWNCLLISLVIFGNACL